MKKYTLEIDKQSYSFYGENFDDAIEGNAFFIKHKKKVKEVDAEKEYVEALEISELKSKLADLQSDKAVILSEIKRLDKIKGAK